LVLGIAVVAMEPLLDPTSLIRNTPVYKQADGFTTEFGI
jgi:hypothetical protein